MVRWITTYIGTASWSYAKVISGVEILDVRDLVDGIGNPNELVAEKIKIGVDIITQHEKLIVCCEYGMSRSNAIAVGIICNIENITFNESLKLVTNTTKEDQIKLSVLKSVNQVITRNGERITDNNKRILIIDYDDYIAKSLVKSLETEECIVLSGSNLSKLINNTALFYLFIIENEVKKIVFISCEGVINTNVFIGNLLSVVKNILDVCINSYCDLYFISTLEVFLGYNRKRLTLTSKTTKNPRGNKGMAYSLAEDLLNYYKRNYKFNLAIIRTSIVYGEHTTKPYFILNFIKQAKSNNNIKIHRYINNLAWVNLIHVKDLARFISEIIQKEQYNIYNIDGGEEINTNVISKSIIEISKSKSKVSFIDLDSNIVKINIKNSDLEALDWKPQENFYTTIKTEIREKKSN